MSGETADISPFAAFKWYEWVKFCETSVSFPEDQMVLGCDLGPAIDVGPVHYDPKGDIRSEESVQNSRRWFCFVCAGHKNVTSLTKLLFTRLCPSSHQGTCAGGGYCAPVQSLNGIFVNLECGKVRLSFFLSCFSRGFTTGFLRVWHVQLVLLKNSQGEISP